MAEEVIAGKVANPTYGRGSLLEKLDYSLQVLYKRFGWKVDKSTYRSGIFW